MVLYQVHAFFFYLDDSGLCYKEIIILSEIISAFSNYVQKYDVNSL